MLYLYFFCLICVSCIVCEYIVHVGLVRESLSKPDEEAPIYMAAVLEYLTTEVLELAGDEGQLTKTAEKPAQIEPQHLNAAVTKDRELTSLV